MGVEYIISKTLFGSLSGDERKLGNSHVHQVKSGQPVAPGIPHKINEAGSVVAPPSSARRTPGTAAMGAV